jgi:hypothetical protein
MSSHQLPARYYLHRGNRLEELSEVTRRYTCGSRARAGRSVNQLVDLDDPHQHREGLSSCLARPCHHTVDSHPAEVSHRIDLFAKGHTAFAKSLPARPPRPKVSRPPIVRLRYGLVTRSHPFDGLVGRLQDPGFPTAILPPKLRASDFYPGRKVPHRTRQPSLDAQCGWLKDRFGLSWQIVPTALGQMMADPDLGKAKRAADAMMTMVKLDIAALKAAHSGTA